MRVLMIFLVWMFCFSGHSVTADEGFFKNTMKDIKKGVKKGVEHAERGIEKGVEKSKEGLNRGGDKVKDLVDKGKKEIKEERVSTKIKKFWSNLFGD